MKKEKWSLSEDSLLLKLKNKKLSYLELQEIFTGKTVDSLRNRFYQLNREKNQEYLKQKIGYFDIEADGLKADFSTMLSWSVKERGGENAFDVISRKELFRDSPDKRLISTLIEEIKKYDVIVGYYSTKYDLPYIRTKAERYGLDFPNYGEIIHLDLYYAVKHKLCLSRNSLDNACDYFGIEGKTPLEKDTWRLAKYGDKEALKRVIEHNLGDTEILEELHKRLAKYGKFTKKSL